MSIKVHTTHGQFWVSDDPEKFQLESNIPFPGWVRIICEDGNILWFNWDNVICVGDLDAIRAKTTPSC